MGWRVALYLGIPGILSGCHIASYAAHNLVNEPTQEINQLKLRQRMTAEARLVWQGECARHPAGTYSGAYADGFINGYVDHLDNGGTPGPPAVPPPRYRRDASDFTPTGQMAQRDYLTGFQHGAEAAAAGGGRQNVVVALNQPAPQPEQQLNITCVPLPPADPKTAPMLPPIAPAAHGPSPPSGPPPHMPVRSASLGAPQAVTASPLVPAPQPPVVQAGGSAAPVIGRAP